jgi:hypothetical protein
MKIKKTKDREFTYNFAFATDYVYNVHWNRGIDFTHFMIESSIYLTDQADSFPIVVRFNHSEPRELWENYRMIGGSLWAKDPATGALLKDANGAKVPYFMHTPKLSKEDLVISASKPNRNCKLGDYFHEVIDD